MSLHGTIERPSLVNARSAAHQSFGAEAKPDAWTRRRSEKKKKKAGVDGRDALSNLDHPREIRFRAW